jgi:TetR/AcrR family transcriptional regulator
MSIQERKEIEKQARKNDILLAAEQLALEKGLNNFTTEDLAKKSGYSKGSIYLYFDNKNEIIGAIISRAVKLLYEYFKKCAKKEKNGLDKIISIGYEYMEFTKKNPLYRNIITCPDSEGIQRKLISESASLKDLKKADEEIFNLLTSIIEEGKKDGSINQSIDAQRVSYILAVTSQSIINRIHFSGSSPVKLPFTAEELLEEFYNILKMAFQNKSPVKDNQ